MCLFVFPTGYIGCHADVLDIVDGSCSGKQHCEFTVWSNLNEREDIKPCPEGLEKYLAASYTCVTGMFEHRPIACQIFYCFFTLN